MANFNSKNRTNVDWTDGFDILNSKIPNWVNLQLKAANLPNKGKLRNAFQKGTATFDSAEIKILIAAGWYGRNKTQLDNFAIVFDEKEFKQL